VKNGLRAHEQRHADSPRPRRCIGAAMPRRRKKPATQESRETGRFSFSLVAQRLIASQAHTQHAIQRSSRPRQRAGNALARRRDLLRALRTFLSRVQDLRRLKPPLLRTDAEFAPQADRTAGKNRASFAVCRLVRDRQERQGTGRGASVAPILRPFFGWAGS
jgi:hypothetical protein